MSDDWVVRTRGAATFTDVVDALNRDFSSLSLRVDDGERWLLVTDDSGRALVWIGLSRRTAHTEREAGRHLLPAANPEPMWWTEVCQPMVAATPEIDAGAVAQAMAETLGGQADRWSTAPQDSARPPRADGEREYSELPLDLVNAAEGYLLSSRPVVGVTPWLAEAARWCLRRDRRFVLITPTTTTLTRSLTSYLEGIGARWAVDGGDGLFDGHVGMRLRPDESGALIMSPELHDEYTAGHDDTGVAIVQAERVHTYQDLRVGDFAPAVAAAARDEAVIIDSLGLMEPLEEKYSPALLKQVGAHASPEPAEVYVAGPDSAGMVEVIPQPPGVMERVSLSAPFETHWQHESGLQSWCSAMFAAGTSYAFLGRRTMATTTTVAPRPSPITTPLAALVSARRYEGLDLSALAELVSRVRVEGDEVDIFFSDERDEALAQFMRVIEHLAPYDMMSPPEAQ